MADIRTTGVLDDFNRPDENPLSDGGNWQTYNPIFITRPLRIRSFIARGQIQTFPDAWGDYWVPLTLDGDAEVWGAFATGIEAPQQIGLIMVSDPTSAANQDGYIADWQAGFPVALARILRYDNGVGTLLASAGFTTPELQQGNYYLLRTVGTEVEYWYSVDNGANWTLLLTATDNTYRTDMTIGIYTFSGTSDPGWGLFGGGVARAFTPQIYRILKGFST